MTFWLPSQTVSLPSAQAQLVVEQLDRIVVLRRRRIFRIERDVGTRDRRRRIAGLRQMLVLFRYFGGVFLGETL